MTRIVVGAALALIAGYLWLRTAAANNVCHTILGALDARDCATVTTWHTIYGLGALAGIALAVWGVIMRQRASD